MFGLQKWNMYVGVICTSANTRRSSSVAVRLIKHQSVPGRASSGAQTGNGQFVKGLSKVPDAFQTYVRSSLKSYNLNVKPKSSDALPICANADRAPPGHQSISFYSLRSNKTREILSSIIIAPDIRRYLKNWQKIVRFFLPLVLRRTDAVKCLVI